MSHKSFIQLVSSQTIQLAIACLAGEIFVPGEAARENPACHISYEFWMPPTFVTLFGTIWLPNYEELWNTKLTCKRARPSITIKSRAKLFVESFSGSRQNILQLLQTWETKSVIKRSFSRSKKLYASKQVKEFPKMLQRSNSARDKNHRKSMLECTRNTSALWPLNRPKVAFALSKRRILNSILHPYF